MRGFQLKIIALNDDKGSEQYEPSMDERFSGVLASDFSQLLMSTPDYNLHAEYSLYVRGDDGLARHIIDHVEFDHVVELYRLLSGAPDDYPVTMLWDQELPFSHEARGGHNVISNI